MGLKQILKPVKGVLESPELDLAVAPSLGKIYEYLMGRYIVDGPVDEAIMDVYGSPKRFFEETYLTEGMQQVFDTVLSALERGDGKIILLPSVFGGGKTHTLLALTQGLLSPRDILRAEPSDKAKNLSRKVIDNIKSLGQDELIIIDGEYGGELAPSPVKPLHKENYVVKTLWGLWGHLLGRYDIVREDDENVVAPSIDTLIELFRGKRALILIDEIVEYILRLPEPIRDQVWEQFLRLLKALPQAIQGRKIVVLLTMPMKIVDERIQVESLYTGISRKLEDLYEVLRHQYIVISPVRLEDRRSPEGIILEENEIVKILRKRIFGIATPKLPPKYLLDLKSHYSDTYSEDVFPPKARDIDALLKYYPFHPTYIDTILTHVAERDPEKYQKTRFAITLTRKVVRRLWEIKADPDFIHIWSIDLEDSDTKNLIDPENEYTVYITRMLEGCASLSDPELTNLMVKTVFIRTFLYDGLTFSERIYPDRSDFYWAVYDRGLEAELARVSAALEDVIGRPDVGYIVEQNNLVFFTRILTMGELVKKTAKEIYEREEDVILDELKKTIRNSLTATGINYSPLSKDHSVIRTKDEVEKGLIPEESTNHRAIIYLGTVNERLANRLVQGYMNYNNTSILIDVPSDDISQINLETIKQRTARIMACDRLRNKLDEMFPEDEIKKINAAMLNNLKRGARKNLGKLIIETFKRVWYPEEERPKSSINTEPVKCLLALARSILVKEQKLLDPDLIDFNVLLDELSKVGYDLRKEPKQFSGIAEVFLMNPKLYISDRKITSRVLERFYRSLYLAVYRDKIHWKHIYKPSFEPRFDDSPAESLNGDFNDGDIIGFWDVYVEGFIDQLLEEEREEARPDEVVIKFYVLRTRSGDEEKFRDLAITHRDELPIMLKDTSNTLHLIVNIIKTGFYLDLIPSTKEVNPRSTLKVEVIVKTVGDFSSEVILDTEHGTLEPSSGIPPFNAWWKLISEEKEGTYSYILTGFSDSLESEDELKVKVVGDYEILQLNIADYEPLLDDVIMSFGGLNSITTLRILASRFLRIVDLNLDLEIRGSTKNGGEVEVRITDVAWSDAKPLIQSLDQLVKRDFKAALKSKEEKHLEKVDVKRVKTALRVTRTSLFESSRGLSKEFIIVKRKMK